MSSRMQVVHDDSIAVPQQGMSFLNCGKCLAELPDDESPMSYARQQVGMTGEGALQVWCVRHDVNIDTMTFRIVEE